ncbi:ParB N-terminal domain-containing protein [Pseudalkalibacillus hwajinpoensis]|uniref:ParB N-terminal domain-containing protein n=1 Tax=Guptibacillus hwajinpoensis TaxID=208199 RepID=UPI001CD58C62|nr:ParB N-terminal domain-containing protein [Pseudalkalibacillus hwajinpoensis]MCA0991402.1 ParB/RepB/Spo0J family partition protein [Pseudalkalibacillus hwajinpoensis]
MKDRKIKMNKNYVPLVCNVGDEIFRNGLFYFNITRMTEDIHAGHLHVDIEMIDVKEWFNSHFHSSINEEHLPLVNVDSPIIQAEIRPGMYEIIDGNHRIEKAYREELPTIQSYKLKGEQLLPYFKDKELYVAFVEYWNSKLI